MSVNAASISLIKEFEGLRLVVTEDFSCVEQ